MHIIKISPRTSPQLNTQAKKYESRSEYHNAIRNQLKGINIELDICYDYELKAYFYIYEGRMVQNNKRIQGYDSSNLLKPLEEAIKPLIKVDDMVFSDVISKRMITSDPLNERIEFKITKLDLSCVGKRNKKFAEYLVWNLKNKLKTTVSDVANHFNCSPTTIRRASKTSIFKDICKQNDTWFFKRGK